MLDHDQENARASRSPEPGDTATTRRIRPKSIALAGIAGALLIGVPTVLVGVGAPAGAAVPAPIPTFPDNLNVFPNRDFVSIDGYSEHAGQPATVTVTRPGVGVVGEAVGIVSGGDVAFEVNHPGGICWGNAPGTPNVTPDIQPYDVVSISFNGVAVGATTVQDVQAFDAVQNGTTVTVAGHIGADVNVDNVEQRIIEPALRDTVVNKRDVRAVPGDLAAANKGGYSSSLSIDPAAHTFLATYIFDDVDSATIAANAGLGERAMAWEFTDPAANRQGMTIAENGEPGGPGMGGCPNGPLQSGPPGPTNVVAARVTNGTGVKVNWTPAVAIPGTPAIDGYRVTAIAPMTGGEQVEIGKKIANPNANSTTINGLLANTSYDVEVVSYSSTGYTFPAINASVAVDSTPPIVSASPAGGSYPVAQQVELTSNEIGTDIYYTLDGADPIANGELATPEPLHYTGPITIDGNATLKFAGFDPSNNVSLTGTETYTITNDPVPAAPVAGASSVGFQSVALTWSPADAGAPGLFITQYQIDVFTAADATTPLSSVNVNGDVTSTEVTGLTGDTPYWFTVSAKNNINPAFGPASAKIGPLTPQGPLVAFAGIDQSNVTRNTVVTLSGAGSTVTNATYKWTQVAAGPNAVSLTGANTINASFTLPFFKYPMTNQALTFQLDVTANGVTKSDQVVITPHSDTMSITKATWKVGDFRVVGVGAPGSTVTARNATTGAVLGTTTVIADGSFDLRNRATNIANPVNIYVDSNMGGTVGPFRVAG
ncbi:MAG TPA: fibronectin type III domain-containing protein [Ilumatobacteraceae bacterium]